MTNFRLLFAAMVFGWISIALPCSSMADGPQPAMGARTKEQFDRLQADQFKHMVRGTAAALAEKQTADDLAAFTRNYYKALVEQGFTAEQAISLVGRITFPIGGSPAHSGD